MRVPLSQRFTQGDPDECWILDAAVRRQHGYGKVGSRWAHRAVYEMLVGPIPKGLELDHLCMVKDCVNPNHLEPVTRQENLLRRHMVSGRKCGHPYVPGKNCYECAKAGQDKLRQRYKEGTWAPPIITCMVCGQEKERCAKGMCRKCYNHERRSRGLS